MNLPEQTVYELKALKRLKDGEGNYGSAEERDAVADRMIYSIMQVIIARIFEKLEFTSNNF